MIVGKAIKNINFVLKSYTSIKDINKIKPNTALIVFDLSPVINTDMKIIDKRIKNIILPNFIFLKKINIWADNINIKPFIKAAAIGSSLKKLTTLLP